MKIEMSTTIQVAPYETRRFSVELGHEDFARELERFDTPVRRLNALHLLGYQKCLEFEWIHDHITPAQMTDELRRVKGILLPAVAVNVEAPVMDELEIGSGW